MKLRFSISLKLLLLILPLVCIPIAIVGYLSIQASVERVNRLVRHEEMIKVKTTANKISDVFYYCRLDLKTISQLPVLEDYHIARSFRLEEEAGFIYENIVQLFKDFIGRAPYYHQIRYLDRDGRELVKVERDGAVTKWKNCKSTRYFQAASDLEPSEIYISDILHSPSWDGRVVYWGKAIYSGWNEFSGVVVIDLDYDKIIEIVKRIRVGEQGYAFLIDQQGRSIAHPQYEPYAFRMEDYPSSTLQDLIKKMMEGGSAWDEYSFQGEKKMAAFAPVPSLGWSLAATIPRDELRREAHAIQARVVQVVLGALLFSALAVSLLTYFLLHPVRSLVSATNRIAKGDLTQEIPVKTRDELGDLSLSFNHMIRNLARIQNELVRSEKLISLGRLSAGVAHEIRNPLNAMKGAIVHLQRRRKNDPLLQEYTQLVYEEIDRLNRFVTEFLYFARQSMPEKVPTDLNKIILYIQDLFGKQAWDKGIVLHNRLSPGLPCIDVDPHQMEQVLVNILINAMDAVPEKGEIVVSTRWLEGDGKSETTAWVRLSIHDNGVGISDEQLKNVFDPFFSTKETGTGLGLPLSLGIIKAHGGDLRITSRPGQGTTVIIELPLEAKEKAEG